MGGKDTHQTQDTAPGEEEKSIRLEKSTLYL